MADHKQVERLRKSVAAWNAWVARYDKPIDLTRANLDGATIYGANLTRANLDGANLDGATIYGANLTRANLTRANLTRANLTRANLDGANLTRANLDGANLTRANLDGANLTRANLHGATIYGANLTRANLDGANLRLPPPMLLLANWGEVSDELCRDLMRYDAANHPNGNEAFHAWADGGECPYENTNWLRAARFTEKKKMWSPGPAPSTLSLCERLLAEKCKEPDEETKNDDNES